MMSFNPPVYELLAMEMTKVLAAIYTPISKQCSEAYDVKYT
jgi:hypothetical protein